MTAIISPQLTRMKERLDELRIPVGTFALVLGITPSGLTQALRGVYRLSAEREKQCAEISLLLLELDAALRPARISSDPNDLAMIVEHLRKHGIDPNAVREAMTRLFGGAAA
jgi:hypothetical protein